MASRGANSGGGGSLRAWAESNARLLVLGVASVLGGSVLGLLAAHRRGLLEGAWCVRACVQS